MVEKLVPLWVTPSGISTLRRPDTHLHPSVLTHRGPFSSLLDTSSWRITFSGEVRKNQKVLGE